MGVHGSKQAKEERRAKEWGYADEIMKLQHSCFFRVYHEVDPAIGQSLENMLPSIKGLEGKNIKVVKRNAKRTLVSYSSDVRIEPEQGKIIEDEIKKIAGTQTTTVSWVLRNAQDDVEGNETMAQEGESTRR